MSTTIIKRYLVCPCCRGSKVVGWLWWEKECPQCHGEGGYVIKFERRTLTGDYGGIYEKVMENKGAMG